MITGLNHINLAVRDIETSFRFYKDILGLTPLCKSEGSAYLLAGKTRSSQALWLSLDLDRNQLRKPALCNTHIAFSVFQEDFDKMADRILASGAQIYKQNSSPGDSLYFLDPDDHKIEIHVGDWKTRVEQKKINSGNWKNVEWFI